MQRGLVLCLGIILLLAPEAGWAKKRRGRRYPPVTHPVVLWSRTVQNSDNNEERTVAAFKLSHYTLPIFQEEVINTLLKCMRDPDFKIKVLCTKAMGRAGNAARNESIRKSLLEAYKEDASLSSTLVRTFTTRKDNHPNVREALLDNLKKQTDAEELTTLLKYFETYAVGSDVDAVVDLYNRVDNSKVKRSAVKVLAERAQGQGNVTTLLAQCSESSDTPLALICLSGLQSQARTDSKTWTVLEKTIQSGDADVLLATLDVIQSLPEQTNTNISNRLVEIANSTEDSEVLEKTLLALGVCGDKSEPIVKVLQKNLERKDVEEGTRITAALVLGKQATKFPDEAKEALSKCLKSGSQSFKTACQLGLQELDSRKPTAASNTPAAVDKK